MRKYKKIRVFFCIFGWPKKKVTTTPTPSFPKKEVTTTSSFHKKLSQQPQPLLILRRWSQQPQPLLILRRGFNPPPIPRPFKGGGSTAPARCSYTKVPSTHQRVGVKLLTQQSCDFLCSLRSLGEGRMLVVGMKKRLYYMGKWIKCIIFAVR